MITDLNDTEIWRTSTAEPTATGIIWTYTKDVTPFLSLWKAPQTIIFDLGNLVNEIYTAPFNTTLTATFFSIDDANELPPADLVIPLSARKSAQGQPSAFKIPDASAISTFSIPANVQKAVFAISATGQIDEEFWFTNVLDSSKSFFGQDAELLAHSPFREVQLLIDGQLAGVAWPFPTIFTGGIAPVSCTLSILASGRCRANIKLGVLAARGGHRCFRFAGI